jgi:MFS family permease
MRNLLRNHDARLMVAGSTLSILGDRVMFIALGIWVKELTGSSAAAGLVFFVLVLPYLVSPAFGILVDRVRRRPLMIAINLAIGVGVLLLLFVHGEDQVWLIYTVAFLYGLSGAVLESGQSALLTVILPAESLGEMNGLLQTFGEGLRLVAPLIGAGMLATVGAGSVAILDAATFGAAALCLSLLHVREERPAPPEHHFLHEMSLGFRYVVGTEGLRRIVFTVGVALLVVGFTETLIYQIVDVGLHRPPTFLGVLLSIQGIGAIFGALTAGRTMRRLGDGRLVGAGLIVAAVGGALVIVPNLPMVAIGTAVFGVAVPWVVVGYGTAIQLRTPPILQGRVAAAAEGIVVAPQTASIAVGAALSTVFDYRILYAVMALVFAATGAALFVGRLPEATALADAQAADVAEEAEAAG